MLRRQSPSFVRFASFSKVPRTLLIFCPRHSYACTYTHFIKVKYWGKISMSQHVYAYDKSNMWEHLFKTFFNFFSAVSPMKFNLAASSFLIWKYQKLKNYFIQQKYRQTETKLISFRQKTTAGRTQKQIF